jgi:hypothetical protein
MERLLKNEAAAIIAVLVITIGVCLISLIMDKLSTIEQTRIAALITLIFAAVMAVVVVIAGQPFALAIPVILAAAAAGAAGAVASTGSGGVLFFAFGFTILLATVGAGTIFNRKKFKPVSLLKFSLSVFTTTLVNFLILYYFPKLISYFSQ